MTFIKNGKFRLLATIAVAFVMLFGLPNIVAADTGNSKENFLDLPLAEMYAEHFGVTVDEALQRLQLQNAFPDLEPEITKSEPETFGGLWLQHEPEFKVIVAFTRNGENTITKYSDYIPEEIAPYIEVRTVEKSLVELLNDQEKLAQSAEAQGIKVESWLNIGDNRVEINIRTSDKNAYDIAVSEGKIVQPDKLNINLVESLTQPETDIYGGLNLKLWLLGGLYVTSGFSVIETATGEEGIITAGHAEDGLWYGSNSLTFEDESYGGSCDVQWHTHSSLNFENIIQIYDNGQTLPITGVRTRDQQTLYSFVSKYGQASGDTVGRLESKTFVPTGFVPNPNATWMLVSNYFDLDDLSAPGDSGGPWYFYPYALGIHHGSYTVDDMQYAVYMAINYIDALGLEVMTE